MSTVPVGYILNSGDALAPNLDFAYLFNEGSGTVDADRTSNANNSSFVLPATPMSAAITWGTDVSEGKIVTITPAGTIGGSGGGAGTFGAEVRIPNATAVNQETYTVSLRFKTSANPGSGYAIMWQPETGNPYPLAIYMDFGGLGVGNGFVQAQCFNGTALNPIVNSLASLNDGAWHTIIVTRLRGGFMRMFIDGVYTAVTADTTSTGTTLNSNPVGVGGTFNAGRAWQGLLSWMQGWSTEFTYGAVALTQVAGGQIADLYNHPLRMWVAAAPTVTNANINAAGNLFTSNFSAPSPPMLPASAATGMLLHINGQAFTITGGACASSAYTGTPTRIVFAADTVLQEYIPGNITDSTPSALAAVTDGAVTNNSTVSAVETNVYGTTALSGQVILNGTPNANNDPVNIYQGTTSGGESGTPVASSVSLPHTISGLTNGTPYFFKVKTVGAGGVLSAFSNETSIAPVAGASSSSAAPSGSTFKAVAGLL